MNMFTGFWSFRVCIHHHVILLFSMISVIAFCSRATGMANNVTSGFASELGRWSIKSMPRIYVYPNSARFRDMTGYNIVSMYSLEISFPQMLMASPFYEPDPAKADFHYVHVYMYHNAGHGKVSEGQLGAGRAQAIIAELQQLGPWWDKNNRTHIWPMTTDAGFCRLPWGHHIPGYAPFLKDSMILEHYGRVLGVLSTFSENCHLGYIWGDKCDALLASVNPLPGLKEANPPCYVQGKDLLVPTIESEDAGASRYLNSTLASFSRTKLMFYAGMTETMYHSKEFPTHDSGYSGGVRQTVMRLYSEDPRFDLHRSAQVPAYYDHMASAIFCLAPHGLGWGARVKTAITRGCIPVIVQDGIKVEFEDALPFHEFAFRLPSSWLHRLPEILEMLMKQKNRRDAGRTLVEKMQRNLRCVWPLFWWGDPWGRAFDMTMCVLSARMAGWDRPKLDLATCMMQCSPEEKPWKIHREASRRRKRADGSAGHGSNPDGGLGTVPAQGHIITQI